VDGIRHWLSDPQASATLAIALVAGIWAITQFRPVARERRRETHDAMASHYAELHTARADVTPAFPALVFVGQIEVGAAATEALGAQGAKTEKRDRLARLAADYQTWERFGISFTAAGELFDSEAKFRAVLWAIETIKEWRGAPIWLNGRECPVSALQAAERLAHDLNAFLFHYENGGYPARQTLGLLHRSLAITSKALEPLIWERSLNARWARRVLRIGIAAQHFNDVTPAHATSDIWWTASDAQHLIHPRLQELVAGRAIFPSDSPGVPRLLPGVRIRLRGWYWLAVGRLSPTPRVWFLSYGGWRLRDHRRRENELAGLLSLALRDFVPGDGRPSLDFSWDLDLLRRTQTEIVNERRRSQSPSRS
jgi:hypothetical protein